MASLPALDGLHSQRTREVSALPWGCDEEEVGRVRSGNGLVCTKTVMALSSATMKRFSMLAALCILANTSFTFSQERIGLNTASKQQLMTLTLEGVDAEIADKIIAGRPYKSIVELIDRKIIGDGLYDKIKDKISIGLQPPPKRMLIQIANEPVQ